ncbi:MAG: hypothetical protein KatS3mg131_0298 [Candidatus Tectimicrobiota bacterium]|nr:MAG: hypothetical protein KatS3mg131_0298 [Candidatus Tectomicrobia bacterium]
MDHAQQVQAQRLENQVPEPCCPGATAAFVHTCT